MDITETLEIPTDGSAALDLARKHAPIIRFDAAEPFFPSVVGYTVFESDGPSSSFPREIKLPPGAALAIEYAIWWDWDIQHLYELEHVWVYVDGDGRVVDAEASWHGGYNRMAVNGQVPLEDGRVVVHSEPGKHAFAPSDDWLARRKPVTLASCTHRSGAGGVHVTPLFKGVIQDRNPNNNQLVRTYLERRQFQPTFDFSRVFPLDQVTFTSWERLFEWIPQRISWWVEELDRIIPWGERRVLRIAHRGASAHATENSAAAIDKAAELGADMVEVDVRITADGVPVISHDEDLRRVYGVDGTIATTLYADLEPLGVMRFDTLVARCKELALGLYLDIKAITRQAAQAIYETVSDNGMTNYTIFSSFRPDFVAEFKAYFKDVVTSILFSSVNIDPVALAQAVDADYVHPCWENQHPQPHTLMTPEWLDRVRAAGLGIICWHEERPAEIAALKALGVTGICSDQPELLL
jgi:glycerophosphoryl diester phosphodiesterase